MSNNSNEWLGQKFGRLTVVGFVHATPPYRGWCWECKCDCGKTKVLIPRDVKSGKVKSCGCFHDERCRERATKFQHSVYEYKRLYSIYNGIKKRCYNTNEPRYKDYGARGIRMCEEWLNSKTGFDSFVSWSITHNYSENLSIDRIDPNGDYSPENCRWITLQEQSLNKRETLWVNYKGERIQLSVLCKRMNLCYDTIHNRIYSLGWDVDKAIETPSQQEKSLMSKCKEHNIKYNTVLTRIHRYGWDEEKALNTPVRKNKLN